MDSLLSALNEHYHATGSYPRVYVSRIFGEENIEELQKLHGEDIKVFWSDEIGTDVEDWRIE